MSGTSPARCLYLDLDGTLLGRGASLLHDGEGVVSLDGIREVQDTQRPRANGAGSFDAINRML